MYDEITKRLISQFMSSQPDLQGRTLAHFSLQLWSGNNGIDLVAQLNGQVGYPQIQKYHSSEFINTGKRKNATKQTKNEYVASHVGASTTLDSLVL